MSETTDCATAGEARTWLEATAAVLGTLDPRAAAAGTNTDVSVHACVEYGVEGKWTCAFRARARARGARACPSAPTCSFRNKPQGQR
eukprot:1111142-Pleurochrysis_carterae.AAC.1